MNITGEFPPGRIERLPLTEHDFWKMPDGNYQVNYRFVLHAIRCDRFTALWLCMREAFGLSRKKARREAWRLIEECKK